MKTLITIQCHPADISEEIDKAVQRVKDTVMIGSYKVSVQETELIAVVPCEGTTSYWHYLQLRIERR